MVDEKNESQLRATKGSPHTNDQKELSLENTTNVRGRREKKCLASDSKDRHARSLTREHEKSMSSRIVLMKGSIACRSREEGGTRSDSGPLSCRARSLLSLGKEQGYRVERLQMQACYRRAGLY